MTFKPCDYENLSGLDVDWFAIDEQENVGYFTSAGHGPLPAAVNANLQVYKNILEYFADTASTVSPEVESENLFDYSGVATGDEQHYAAYCESILSLGRKGLFCFDAVTELDGRYVRLAVPCKPLRIGEIPVEFRQVLAAVRLPCLFRNCRSIT